MQRRFTHTALGIGLFCAACAEGTGIDGSGGGATSVGPVTSSTQASSTSSGDGGAALTTSSGLGGSGLGGENAGGFGGSGGAGTTATGTTSTGVGGQGGGGDVVPPTVLSTFPASGASALSPGTKLDVTFSEPMQASSISTHLGSTCSGSLQVSADNFASCVPMLSQPTSGDNMTFSLTPAAPLASLGSYRIRVQQSAQDLAQNGLAQTFTLASPFHVRFFHTLAIDGVNDFVAQSEQLASSTGGTELYITHDEATLYVGLVSPDITTVGAGNKFIYFLFSTDVALNTGGLQSSDGKATFGSNAKFTYHYKERIAGGVYSEYRVSNGNDWTQDWSTTGKTSFKADGYLEASIALDQFGGVAPQTLSISAFTVDYDGAAGSGWVYNMLSGATDGAGVPARDLVKYLRLDFPATDNPNSGSNLLNL